MSIKHTNRDLEKLALRTICADQPASQFLLGSVTEAHFGNPQLRGVYKRIANIARLKSQILTWPEILVDGTIPEAIRESLQSYDREIPVNIPNCRRLVAQLDHYRKLRVLYQTVKTVDEAFQNDKVEDVDALLQSVNEQLTMARSTKNETRLFHYGVGNNTTGIVKDILYGDNNKNYIPTGIQTFDRQNRGIFRGSLFTIAATTGGGKTTLALQLQHNFASFGAKVCLVSLEMNETEIARRNLANWSGVNLSELLKGRDMRPEFKQKVQESYKARVVEMKTKGSRESVYVPDEDVGIEEIMFTLKPYNYDVVIIDYISLLKGADGDDQWRRLGAIARFAKIYANNTNTIVVLLAQLSDEGAIRYSKAVQEHSSNFWAWIYDQRARETGTIFVQQYKARNQKAFPFYLKEEFGTMVIRDLTDQEIQTINTNMAERSADGKAGSTKTRNALPHQKRAYQTHKRNTVDDGDNYLESRVKGGPKK